MIELRLLRYFVVVAETEHVGRAAERLHISQSPLSRQIRQLEDLLGVALFERAGREIKLTSTGRRLLEPARDLLGRADAFVRDARVVEAAEPPRLALGFVGTAMSTGVLPAALRTLRAQHPNIAIELRHAKSDVQLAMLRDGELDLALVHAAPNARGLQITRILDQPYCLVVARTTQLARRRLTARALGDEPWVVVRSGEQVRERWLLACAAAGFTPRIAVEVTDYASALALVNAGVGVALLPASQQASAPTGLVFRTVSWLRLRSELWAVCRAHAPALVSELIRSIV